MESSPNRISCVVDSDVAIDFLRSREYARDLLRRWQLRGLLAVSTITHVEIMQGMRPHEARMVDVFLDGFVALPVDVSVARRAGTLLNDLRRQGKTVGMADAIIGATALGLDVPLLTNNVGHYDFPGLRVVRGMVI